jgi:hypothetical protein
MDMVGRSVAASCVAPVLQGDTAPAPSRKSAEIVHIGRTFLPPMDDYLRACADLLWRTFPAPSANAVCDRAEAETGIASADTYHRILSGQTKKPDGYVIHVLLHFAHARGVKIPAALAIRGSVTT